MLKRKNKKALPEQLEDSLYPDDYWLDKEDGQEVSEPLPDGENPVSGKLRKEPMVTGYEALERQRGVRRPKRKITRREKKALKQAQLDEFVKSLDEGLDTMIGEAGVRLSGGQRQAITLLMASIQKPKLLLLDEHTAALDPKTAAKVLEISDQIISENHLTAMMVTHNMKDAIAHGNRLIMMHEGKVILNIAGEDKKKLTVGDLLHQFEKVSGEEFASDKALLS